MNTQVLIQGLHAKQMQWSAVSVVNNRFKTDCAMLLKANNLISKYEEAVKILIRYCSHTGIKPPDVDEHKFLQWCKQRDAYFKKAV